MPSIFNKQVHRGRENEFNIRRVTSDTRQASGHMQPKNDTNNHTIRLPNGTINTVPVAIASAIQLHQTGRLKQALAIYELILQATPGNSDALHLKGLISHQTGNHQAAASLIRKAIRINPSVAIYHNNLAKTYLALHMHHEATIACSKSMALQPDMPESLFLMGNALLAETKLDAAELFISRLLDSRPDFFNAYTTLVEILCRQNRADEALEICRKAMIAYPDDPTLICATGFALVELKRTSDVVAHYKHALARNPSFAQAENNLANAFTLQGRIEEAISHYQNALALAPTYSTTNSSLLMALNYRIHQDSKAIYFEHRKYSQRFELPLQSSAHHHRNDRSSDRRLNIGYVSSDFRKHAVAHFIEPVLRNHDRNRFSIFCYYNSFTEDDVTRRIQAHAGKWRNIKRLSDDAAARQILDDKIDILIDLNGHTGGNRLLVFARKPAPVQITWIGYPNTTGLSSMDFRITDEYADPAHVTDQYYSEQLIRLPHSFLCYQPPDNCPAVAQLPAHRNDYITFGSFNNLNKITSEVIALWARILESIPNSRLVLKTGALNDPAIRSELQNAFHAHSPLGGRLQLLGHSTSTDEHFAHYNNIDIGLDPFPYNGTTTTCDALWMGVPVITLEGNSHASRVGFSQLSNLGMPEFIAHSPEEYIVIANKTAADLVKLEIIRLGLRNKMKDSPLTDAALLTRNLENVFIEKWEAWRKGKT